MCIVFHIDICIVNRDCYYVTDKFFFKSISVYGDLSWHMETRSDIVPQ